jgi:hypothetical protein
LCSAACRRVRPIATDHGGRTLLSQRVKDMSRWASSCQARPMCLGPTASAIAGSRNIPHSAAGSPQHLPMAITTKVTITTVANGSRCARAGGWRHRIRSAGNGTRRIVAAVPLVDGVRDQLHFPSDWDMRYLLGIPQRLLAADSSSPRLFSGLLSLRRGTSFASSFSLGMRGTISRSKSVQCQAAGIHGSSMLALAATVTLDERFSTRRWKKSAGVRGFRIINTLRGGTPMIMTKGKIATTPIHINGVTITIRITSTASS